MRVKRYILALGLVCAVAAAFAVVGMGANKKSAPKIALVEHVRVPAVEIFAYGARAAAAQLQFPLDVTGPQQYNVQQQQQMSEAEANAGAKGIIEILVGASAWKRHETELMNRGIKVANIGVYTGPFLGKKTPIYVGPNDIAYGRSLGNLLVKALGPNASGEVVIGTCVPGLEELTDRYNGVKQALAQSEPNVKLTGPLFAHDDPTTGVADWQKIVQVHSDALAFVGLCSTAPADLAKVKSQTPGAKWLIVGGELDPGTLQGIKNGDIYGVVDASIWPQGYIAARLLYAQATNPKIPTTGWIDPGIEVVTKTNVDAVIARENGTRAHEAQFYRAAMNKIFANLKAHIKPLAAAHR